MRRLLCLAVMAAATVTGLPGGPPPASAGQTVCANDVPRQSFSRKIRANGELIARLWIHSTRDGRSCSVLRAVKWKGTPHYMFVQACARQTAPRKATGCSTFDAGAYRYYAGPVYHPQQFCTAVRVKVDVPGGRRVVDRFVSGPCD